VSTEISLQECRVSRLSDGRALAKLRIKEIVTDEECKKNSPEQTADYPGRIEAAAQSGSQSIGLKS
jgi:hypothetical protein